MRFALRSSLAAALVAGAFLIPNTPASAADQDANCEVGEACFFYEARLTSGCNFGYSWADFNHSISNFGTRAIYLGEQPGQGERVKNNSKAVWNRSSRLNVRVFFNSGYAGAYDTIRYSTCANLYATWQENASFKFID